MRPVTLGADGALLPLHSQVKGKREAQVLDRLRIGLSQSSPKPHQPENWLLERRWYNPWHRPCRLVVPGAVPEGRPLLEAHLAPGPELLGSHGDRVDYNAFTHTPAQASLALVRPDGLRWLIKKSGSGKRQTRAFFTLAGVAYSLSVTDPIWEQKVEHMSFGTHPRGVAGIDAESDVLLTISLGEPFDGCCYKLVAAIIVLPPQMKPEGLTDD